MGLSARLQQAAEARTARQDGYSPVTAKAVCDFQAWAERQPNCNYNALRDTLKYARDGREYTCNQLISLYTVQAG